MVVIEQSEDSAVQKRTLEALFRTTPAGYKRLLLAARFQGKELPVITVLNSDETAIQFVWNVPGAIAIVDVAAATAARVKLLRIDGRFPEEKGYPLQ